ncbi:MAG: hypothetical protein AAGH15_06690 [Myxococcota bacterium]
MRTPFAALALALGLAGCGDDAGTTADAGADMELGVIRQDGGVEDGGASDDGGEPEDGGTPSDAGDLGAGTGDGGSGVPDAYDCEVPPFTSCDNIVCLTDTARGAIELACIQPDAPPRCLETVERCFRDYYACILPACPPGVDFADADDEGVDACTMALEACTAPLTEER